MEECVNSSKKLCPPLKIIPMQKWGTTVFHTAYYN